MDIDAESEFFGVLFFGKTIVSFSKGPKTVSTMNEHGGDSERIVTLENGGWRFGKLSGSVAASVPIPRHRQFCELAILVSPDRGALGYAARVAHTDYWLHFNRLHSWMYPIVEELLGIQAKYRQLADMVERTHRLAQ